MRPTCLLETLSRSSVVTFPNPERRAFLLLFRHDAVAVGFQQLFQVRYLLLEHRAVVGVGHQRALVHQLDQWMSSSFTTAARIDSSGS